MKQLVSIIALLAMVLVASSGYNDGDNTLSVGDRAPQIAVDNQYTSFDLDKLRGQYVLITFWSSSDAESRIKCNNYTAWYSKTRPSSMRYIAINFDNEPALFEELVRLDKLDKEAQYNVKGLEAAQIRLDFGLNGGLGTVLISPDGRVDTFNPSTTELSSLI